MWISTMTLTALLAAGGAGDDGESVVLREYDLSHLLTPPLARHTHVQLQPYEWASNRFYEEIEAWEPEWLDPDRVMHLLSSYVEPDAWDYGLAQMSLTAGDGRNLIVLAPVDMQERIAGFMDWLHDNMISRQRLRIAVYSSQGELPPQFANAREARDILQGMKLLTRGSAQLADGNPAAIDSTSARPFVYDWDVEIAQGSAIGDPVIITLETGLKVVVLGAPVAGGTYLDLALRQSDEAAPANRRVLGAQSVLNNKTQVVTNTAIGMVEHPRVRFASFAGSFVIPHGKVLLIPASAQTVDGRVHYVVEIATEGDAPPLSTTLTLRNSLAFEGEEPDSEAAPLSLKLIRPGARTSYGLTLPPVHSDLFSLRHFWELDEELSGRRSAILGGEEAPLDPDTFMEVLRSMIPELDEDVRFSLEWMPPYLMLVVSDDVQQRVQPILDSLTDPGPRYEVEARITDRSGAALGACRIPMLLQRSATLWAGEQITRLVDWDVDVANESAIANPEMQAAVDGYALGLKLTAAPSGRLALSVRAALNFLDSDFEEVSLGVSDRRSVDQLSSTSSSIQDVRYFPAQGGEARWDTGSLSLTLTVKPADS